MSSHAVPARKENKGRTALETRQGHVDLQYFGEGARTLITDAVVLETLCARSQGGWEEID